MHILSDIQIPTQDTLATIGFFDGVHIGHQFLLNELKIQSQKFGFQSLIVSFVNHPQEILRNRTDLKLLTTTSEKLARFETLAIDNCLLLDFDDQIARMTSYDFLKMLHDNYRVRKLMVGYDHHFGSDRLSTFDDYVEIGKLIGVDVIACRPFVAENLTVSSSKIRTLLQKGEVIKANELLGSPYMMSGIVVSGNQIGRKIGFPTANLKLDISKLIPKEGVYAVKVALKNQWFKGMLNIGTRPTVSGDTQTIEVYILNFEQDIYGETLQLKFLKRIRDERKFNSIVELKSQLEIDKLLI